MELKLRGLKIMTNEEKITRTRMRLQNYYLAEEAVLLRQSYKIGSRELEFADLGEIRKQITLLENELTCLERNNGKRKVKRIIPLDI